MKKLALLFCACLTITSIASCGKAHTTVDSDYDGLTDDIDPDPHNNQYRFVLEKETSEKEGAKVINITKEDTVTIDYRNFFEIGDTYNTNLVKLATIFANEHETKDYMPKILNNVYPKQSTEGSTLSPILAQLGGEDIICNRLWDEYKDTNDKCDVANLYQAHHTIHYNDKKHQVFFVILKPYANSSGWFSNFDVGADTQDYIDLTGGHPEWKNKKHHKGFDVTANRLIEKIDAYRNAHIDNDAEVVTYITGQSRGGALANLLGKKLIDDGHKALAYSLNPPATTTEEKEILTQYKTLYSFINRDDFISRVPLKEWHNFDLYGNKYYYQLSLHANEYKNFFGIDYAYNSSDALDRLEEYIDNIISTRESIYVFNDTENFSDEGFDSIEKANAEIDKIKGQFDNCMCKDLALKSINFYPKEVDGVFYACWKIKPVLLTLISLEDSLGKIAEIPAEKREQNVAAYYNVLFDFIVESFSRILSLVLEGKLSAEGFTLAHKPYSSVVGVDFIE